jgi:hypothetical protein
VYTFYVGGWAVKAVIVTVLGAVLSLWIIMVGAVWITLGTEDALDIAVIWGAFLLMALVVATLGYYLIDRMYP